MDTKLKRVQAEKIRRRLAKDLKPHGFDRTKTSFWTRSEGPFVHCIHLQLFTFQPSFRVHLAVRVLNDPFLAPALNGPTSDELPFYGMHFNAAEDTVERCAGEVLRYCVQVGIPWFEKWSKPGKLISEADSPLSAEAKASLQDALDGKAVEENEKQSKALLGLG